VRTSVARLARDGWLAAQRSGRRSEYRLTRGGGERFAEATQAHLRGKPQGSGTGRWTLLVLPSSRQRRAQLRESLKWLGFGQLNPSLLAHPGMQSRASAPLAAQPSTGAADALLLRSLGGDLAADRRLAAQGWDLDELARRYRRFLARFAAVGAAIGGRGTPPQTAFPGAPRLLSNEYRRSICRTPLLPARAAARDWVGTAAYALCRRLLRARVCPTRKPISGRPRIGWHRRLPAANAAATRALAASRV